MENIFILECPDGLRIGHVFDISDCFDRNIEYANASLKVYFGNSKIYLDKDTALKNARDLYFDRINKSVILNEIKIINLDREFPR